MSSLEDLEDVLARVLSATDGARKVTDRERREATEAIRKSALEEGASDLDAVRISVCLATASAEFADACVAANRKARELAQAMKRVEELADRLIQERAKNGDDI